MSRFEEGELAIYANDDAYEIVKIKSTSEGDAFVWCHSGATAAKVSDSRLHKLINRDYIISTTLGQG